MSDGSGSGDGVDVGESDGDGSVDDDSDEESTAAQPARAATTGTLARSRDRREGASIFSQSEGFGKYLVHGLTAFDRTAAVTGTEPATPDPEITAFATVASPDSAEVNTYIRESSTPVLYGIL
jgi:hypothetical protein